MAALYYFVLSKRKEKNEEEIRDNRNISFLEKQ